MKNLFQNNENYEWLAEFLIEKRPPEEEHAILEARDKAYNKALEKAYGVKQMAAGLILYCLAAVLLILWFSFFGTENMGTPVFYSFLAAAVISAGVGYAISRIGKNAAEEYMSSDEYLQAEKEHDAVEQKIMQELGFEGNEDTLEILEVNYMKKIKGVPLYYNIPESYIATDDALLLGSVDGRARIPKSAFRRVERVDSDIVLAIMPGDHPEDSLDDYYVSQYGIKANADGSIVCPYYYKAIMNFQNEDYEWFISPYEIGKFCRIFRCEIPNSERE